MIKVFLVYRVYQKYMKIVKQYQKDGEIKNKSIEQ